MLWTERMLAFEVLPELQRQVRSQPLADAIARHLEQTKEHAARVEQAFRTVGAETSSNLCAPVEKLAEHHDELAEQIVEERLRDTFHAAAAAQTEHQEIALYDALITVAKAMEQNDAVELLEQNRDEERDALEALERETERLAREAVPP
jgi:ferritin-like metal-binding protein YciE